MPSQEIQNYYQATENRETRSDLKFAISIVGEPKIAIDCGCGAGADIAYLLENDFKVYGFDTEQESISRCQKRFDDCQEVSLARADFNSYIYPRASLVVADASLFFCAQTQFNDVWEKIHSCLHPDGVFCGSFLGPQDTMAGPDYDKDSFWPDVSIFDESGVKNLFKNYDICRFTEHKTSGKSSQETVHDWHIFSVVAKKQP
ncbi:MAG: class I SAM-dependent methyltransferase [Arenicella sp.]